MPPPKRVTIVEVAAAAGVAISSVSAAVNGRAGISDDTRRHILATIDDLGWTPSVRGRSLSGKRAFAVGLIVERPTAVFEADPYFAGFIGGVESVLEERGLAMVLQMSSTRERTIERYRGLAAERRVDGVLLAELEVDDARLPLVKELGLPAVVVNPGAPTGLPAVTQDDQAGIAEVVARLVALGHRRIAHLSGDPRFVHSARRERAWWEAVASAGLAPGPRLQGDFTTEGGVRAAEQIAASADRPTAVVCANDLMAIGLISRLTALGISVPDDISVTGFDGNTLAAYIRPALTTLQTSPHRLGAAAARSLVGVLDGDDVDDVELPRAEVVWRDSIASPRR